jgi:hypothetical protein
MVHGFPYIFIIFNGTRGVGRGGECLILTSHVRILNLAAEDYILGPLFRPDQAIIWLPAPPPSPYPPPHLPPLPPPPPPAHPNKTEISHHHLVKLCRKEGIFAAIFRKLTAIVSCFCAVSFYNLCIYLFRYPAFNIQTFVVSCKGQLREMILI